MNARLVAHRLLRDVRVVDRAAFRRAARDAELDDQDRTTLAAILGAEVRRRATLRAICEAFAGRRLRPDVQAFAHVGLAQLLFLEHVPDHAAIGETVEAAREQLGERPSAAVNALLRRVQREIRRGASGDPRRDVPQSGLFFDPPVFADPRAHWLLWAEQALSLPVAIGRRWRNRHGEEEAARLALASLAAPDVSIHVARGDVGRIESELAACRPRRSSHPRILLADSSSRTAPELHAARARGDVALLAEISVRAAEMLAAHEGERVLELRRARAKPHPTLASSGASVEARAPGSPSAHADFDATFIRAPSTGTGALATRPGLRWRFDAARVAELARAQAALLAEAAAATRGRLVYATNSVEPDENQRRVRAFVEAHAGWSIAGEIAALPSDGQSRSPSGGYAALLVRA